MYKKPKKWDESFPINKYKQPSFRILAIGSSESGKSIFFKYLYLTYFKIWFDKLIIITTQTGSHFFNSFVIKPLIFTEWGYTAKSVIEAFKDANTNIKSRGQKPFNIMVVFDDTASRRQFYDPFILDLFKSGRHLSFSTYYISQGVSLLDPVWRNNASLAFIHGHNSIEEYEKIAKMFVKGKLNLKKMTSRKKMEIYIDASVKMTDNYGVIIVDYRRQMKPIFTFRKDLSSL
jgi:hypothetical protein